MRRRVPSIRGTTCVHSAAFLAYAALSVAITWPLVLRLGTAVPHDLGDPVGFTWVLWWNAQALPLSSAWLHAPIFYPSPGAIVFQDTLLGVWPLTTAIQWLGGSPLVAHNLLLISSFALSAFTAYLLCAYLMADRRAGFAGGLVFGFAIYRMVQLPHVNILLTFWVPLILLGLHKYAASRRVRWLALASACWALQALTSGYFLAYSSVLVGLWALFFFRRRLKDYLRLAVAFGLGLAAIWPWLNLYRTVHAAYAFQRNIGEADFWAADVTSLVQAPVLLAIWGPVLGVLRREEQFFPGLTLACVCVLVVASSHYWARPRWSLTSWVLLGAAALAAAVAAIAAFAPTSFQLAGVRFSLGRPFKPLSWTWIALLLAFFFSPPVRRVFRDRSVAGFYALAAFLLWIFALGPTVRFMGERIWYKAPYSWLLVVPGSDAVRVPARFWMLVVLALAVVVAHGIARLRRRAPRTAPVITAAVCAGLLVETWLGHLPLHAPPERFAALETRAAPTPVLELPLGSLERDLGAMYRAMYHRAPLVNGYSGYAPASFQSLRVGLASGDLGALTPYSERMPLDIVIHTETADAKAQAAVVESAGAQLVTATDRMTLYHLPRRDPISEPPPSSRAAIQRITAADGSDVTRRLTADDPFAFVRTDGLAVTLAHQCQVDEVALGAAPGVIGVTVRAPGPDGQLHELWKGSAAERMVRGALANPRLPRLRLRFAPVETDRVQIDVQYGLKEEVTDVLDVRVFGQGCGEGGIEGGLP
jgi:hypothetical protein